MEHLVTSGRLGGKQTGGKLREKMTKVVQMASLSTGDQNCWGQ